jgi:hypothetical protein
LDFYRRKVQSFEAEEKRWRERLRASSGMAARAAKAEEAAERTRGEVRALRAATVELQSALAMERKRAAKMQGENDRLKVGDILFILTIFMQYEYSRASN